MYIGLYKTPNKALSCLNLSNNIIRLCISQFHLRPAPPRATEGHLPALSVQWVGHLGRAFANPGAIPELLTRARFPIRV